MSLSETIGSWFAAQKGASLVLPDGSFGRPHDNVHVLTSIDDSGAVLTLILDQNLLLRFKGLKSADEDERQLVLGPFDRLRFEWTPYGGGPRRTKEYESGVVKFVW